PHLKEHKKQHENLIDIVKAYVKKYNENPEASNYEFLFFLKRWLVEHIMKDDKLMGEYLVKASSIKTKNSSLWWGGLKKLFGR
ncbi:MAG: hypothetical protein WBQ05_14655, partial [Candidatus Competibacter denitrificans]